MTEHISQCPIRGLKMRACERGKDDDVKECSACRRQEGKDIGGVFGRGDGCIESGRVERENGSVGTWIASVEGVMCNSCQEGKVREDFDENFLGAWFGCCSARGKIENLGGGIGFYEP